MGKQDKQQTVQTQESVTNPWGPTMPLLRDIIGKYSGLSTDVTADQRGALEGLKGAANLIPNFGQQGTDALSGLFNSSTANQVGLLNTGLTDLNDRLGATARGDFLDPYATPGFGGVLDRITGDITNKVKGVYAGSGRDPSGAGSFGGSLGRGLAEGIAPVVQSQYNQNVANRDAAARTLFDATGSTAQNITGQEQIPLANRLQALGSVGMLSDAFMNPAQLKADIANMGYSMPFQNIGMLQNAIVPLAGLGGTSSGSAQSTTSTPQNTMSNVIGGVSGALGIMKLLMSDERTKDDIEPIGKLNDGQTVVRFRYKGDAPMRIGLLAQDVEKVEPGAVGILNGIRMVDHERATDRAAKIGRMAA